MDTFTRAYIEAALWASTDEDSEPLDDNYGPEDIDAETLAAMARDCREFQARASDLIAGDLERAGHDFWLTRNGHGAGFWDGDWAEGDKLTEIAKSFGEFNLYTDNGRIYN